MYNWISNTENSFLNKQKLLFTDVSAWGNGEWSDSNSTSPTVAEKWPERQNNCTIIGMLGIATPCSMHQSLKSLNSFNIKILMSSVQEKVLKRPWEFHKNTIIKPIILRHHWRTSITWSLLHWLFVDEDSMNHPRKRILSTQNTFYRAIL